MISLRKMALVGLTVSLALVGAVSAVISYQIADTEADEFLDVLLHQIALNIGPNVGEAAALNVPHDQEDELVIEIWGPGGERLQSSHPEISGTHPTAAGFSNVRMAGLDWRSYTLVESGRTVRVLQQMIARRETAEHAAIHAAAPILAMLPITWLVVGWLFGRIFGRLRRSALAIAERGIESMKPIPLDGIPAEVSPLVGAMNALTGRLQTALDQQRRFIADAAHELRTPLTALHLQIENVKSGIKDDAVWPHLVDLDRAAQRSAALVEQLLKIARFDAATDGPQREAVDLVELAKSCIAGLVSIADRKGVDVGIAVKENGAVLGSRRELETLVTNLIDNAIRYSPANGTVDVNIRRSGDGMVVEVLDTGCGISDEMLPRIFDRFVRGAPSETEGTGLGLAIVKAIADRHGIEVKIANRKDRPGTIARVTFPSASLPATERAAGRSGTRNGAISAAGARD